jgi:hypothetical protein
MTEITRQELRVAVASGDVPRFSGLLRQVDSDDVRYVAETLCVLACPDDQEFLVQAFLAEGFAPDTRGSGGATILMSAAQWGADRIIRLLLAVGADVNAHDNEERTALICAVEGQRERVVEQLMQAGADPLHLDAQGRSALSLAEAWTTGLKLPFGMHLSIRRQTRENPIFRLLARHPAASDPESH